jgi:hypothetical protein
MGEGGEGGEDGDAADEGGNHWEGDPKLWKYRSTSSLEIVLTHLVTEACYFGMKAGAAEGVAG